MERDELQPLLLKLMALADRMEQRDARVIQQLAQQVSGLQQAVQGVSAGGQQFASQALGALRSQGREAIQAGVGQAVEHCSRQLQQTAAQASRTSDEVRACALALHRQRSLWLWTAPLALIVGALLAAGGSGWLAWKNMAELKRAQFGQDILQATRAGVLTRCGEDARLCAKVGRKPERHGPNGEYVLLQGD